MAVRTLRRRYGVRYFLRIDYRRRAVWIDPDLDDLATCPPEALEAFWGFFAAWSAGKLAKHPRWRINGHAATETL